MKNQAQKPKVEITKVVAITVLFIAALLIILFGTVLGVYSIVNNISFSVMSSQIHGAIFGVVIMFLGVRYLLSVQKLKAKVYESTSKFSWSNFKTQKVHKIRTTHR